MPAQWTADLIGEMHLRQIPHKDLAVQAGWHPKYLSAVLNGHRAPKNAEKRLNDAFLQLLYEKEHS